jgi:hypothetical protein
MRVQALQANFRDFLAAPLITGPALAFIGFGIWIGISALGGSREAWDMPAYFYAGFPLMAGSVAVASYHMPRRIWRWPTWLVGGHQAGVFAIGLGMQSGLSLIILLLALAVLLAALFAIPAVIGCQLARRLGERAA